MEPRISFSLNKKLIFLVMAVSVLVLVISAYMSFSYSEEILKQRAADQMISESSTRGNTIHSLIDTRIKETRILATNPEIQTLVYELNQIPLDANYEPTLSEKRSIFISQVQAFQDLVGSSIGFEDVHILGNDGRVLFSLRLILNTDFNYDKKSILDSQKPTSEFVFSVDGTKKMIVTAPIFLKGDKFSEPIGVVIAVMRTEEIDRILLNRSGLGNTGEVYLVNENFKMISESRFIENVIFAQDVNTLPTQKCFEENKEIIDIYPDYRGESVLGSSYCANDLGFVLLAEINESETIEPILILQDRILFTGLIITAGMVALAFFLSRSISRPLIKLKNAANEIAGGNFKIRTNIKTGDEIGELSSTFDSMAKRLEESIIAIKQREELIKQQKDILLQFSEISEKYCVGMVDVVGSTMIMKNLSDAQTSSFYTIFINSMASIVKKFDGVVVKNIGDAILFYFPKTNIQDPDAFKNVLECCFEMRDSHKEINQKMKENSLPTFSYKISVTYGPVRIAKMATSAIDDIFGATVNRCAKINSMAKPNGIVIGDGMYQIVHSLTSYKFTKISEGLIANEYGFVGYYVERK